MNDIKELAETICSELERLQWLDKDEIPKTIIESILRAELSRSDMDLEAEAEKQYPAIWEDYCNHRGWKKQVDITPKEKTFFFMSQFARTVLSRNENINPNDIKERIADAMRNSESVEICQTCQKAVWIDRDFCYGH